MNTNYYIIVDISDGIEGLDTNIDMWYESIEEVEKAFNKAVKNIKSKPYYKVLEESRFSIKYESNEYGKPVLYHFIVVCLSQIR